MHDISVDDRGVPVVVRVDSEDLLQSVMQEIVVVMLLLVFVGSGVLGFKKLCCTSFVCTAAKIMRPRYDAGVEVYCDVN
jgi:hypothetical protein